MPLSERLKQARQEVRIADRLPITHLVDPVTAEAQNGSLLQVIKLEGVPFDTVSESILNQHHHNWHQAIMGIDERFSLLATLHRHSINARLEGQFSNPLSKQIHDAYLEPIQNRALYQNDLFLVVIYKGISEKSRANWTNAFRRMSSAYLQSQRQARRTIQCQQLTDTVHQLCAHLSDFNPRILGERDNELGYSELIAYLSLVPNGGEPVSLPNTISGSNYTTHIDSVGKKDTCYPNGHIGHYLTRKDIFFGEAIAFESESSTRFASMVSIKRYGTTSSSLLFDPLLLFDGEYIATHSFTPEAQAQADKRIKRQLNKLRTSDDAGIREQESLGDARDSLASGEIAFGVHHHTVMVFAETLISLREKVVELIKQFASIGIVAVKERLGQEPAFWAQIPTHLQYVARASLISSQNFADFFPLHNYRRGYKDENYLGSAVTLVETPAKTPVWFNLHAKGPKQNPSPGHTTIIGGNGSGKTVLMCFLDAALNRYGHQSVFFDRNRGMEPYVRASGGSYTVLSPDFSDEIRFNPFQLEDTRSNRAFCRTWLQQLVLKPEEHACPSDIAELLDSCVDYAYESLQPKHRTLSNATQLLPVNFSRFAELNRWRNGTESREEGAYAYLFDNEQDALSHSEKLGFDLTHFLDHESSQVLTPILMYLFHRVELLLNEGERLTSVFLDEAWQYLDNAFWKNRLKHWLPTLRKLNCHLILATQSPKSVASSSISHTILDNAATQIYFANPQAKRAHYIDGFNLTEGEFYQIEQHSPQSRVFLYKQGHDSLLATLNLSTLGRLLPLLSATQKSVRLLDRLRKIYGDDPSDWLPHFLKGVNDEA